MIIVHERKRKEFKVLFPTVELFIEYLKTSYSSLNFDNNKIEEKINKAYEFFVNTEEILQYTRLTRNLHRGFYFSHKNVTKIEYWVERGWSKEWAFEILEKDKSERAKKQSETKKNLLKEKDIFIENEDNKEFRFISGVFYSKVIPCCNICNSQLKIKKVNINNLADKFYYEIKKCSNIECKSSKLNKNEKYRSFLPKKVADEVIDKIANNIKQKNILSIDSWLKKGFSKEDAEKSIAKIQSENSKKRINPFIPTKENLKKYGYTNEEIYEICLTPTQVKFWMKNGLSIEESNEKINKLQKENANKFSEKIKLNPVIYSAYTESQTAYWVNKGFSEQEAKKKVSERQSAFSLEKCVEKFGEEIGIKKFNERQEKWQKSLNENGNLKIGYSKISQELFWELLNNYTTEEKKEIFFATKNEEFRINRNEGGVWIYDFVDLKRKKIIEFHGDMYHGNPKKYMAEDCPHPFRKNITAKEMWEKDEKKKKLAEENGFEVLAIWDSEYRWGKKQDIINLCLEFLEIKK